MSHWSKRKTISLFLPWGICRLGRRRFSMANPQGTLLFCGKLVRLACFKGDPRSFSFQQQHDQRKRWTWFTWSIKSYSVFSSSLNMKTARLVSSLNRNGQNCQIDGKKRVQKKKKREMCQHCVKFVAQVLAEPEMDPITWFFNQFSDLFRSEARTQLCKTF